MGDRDWERQKALFDAASRLPADEREAWLEQACEDKSLRQTVAGLLIDASSTASVLGSRLSSNHSWIVLAASR